jgi:succinyl-CoA synthetase beta subunit
VDSVEAVRQAADTLIGSRLVTPQTGPEGRLVQRVLVEQAQQIGGEYYIGLLLDRAQQRITIILERAVDRSSLIVRP